MLTSAQSFFRREWSTQASSSSNSAQFWHSTRIEQMIVMGGFHLNWQIWPIIIIIIPIIIQLYLFITYSCANSYNILLKLFNIILTTNEFQFEFILLILVAGCLPNLDRWIHRDGTVRLAFTLNSGNIHHLEKVFK